MRLRSGRDYKPENQLRIELLAQIIVNNLGRIIQNEIDHPRIPEDLGVLGQNIDAEPMDTSDDGG